jgi:hypothetical protein
MKSYKDNLIVKGLNSLCNSTNNIDQEEQEILRSKKFRDLEYKANLISGRGKYVTPEMHKKWLAKVFADDEDDEE